MDKEETRRIEVEAQLRDVFAEHSADEFYKKIKEALRKGLESPSCASALEAGFFPFVATSVVMLEEYDRRIWRGEDPREATFLMCYTVVKHALEEIRRENEHLNA